MMTRVPDLLRDRQLVPQAFDRVAHRYDRLTSLNPGYDDHLRAAAAHLEGCDVVVDLCCGTGRSTAALRNRRVVGIDMSAAMLARNPYRPRVRADAAAPPLRDSSVDGVFMAYGLRNMGDPDGALDEIRRVLRPGGRLVLHEYALTDRRSRITWAVVAHAVIIPTGWLLSREAGLYRYLYRSVSRFDTADQLVERLRAHAFVDVDRHDTTHWQRGITHSFTATRP